MAIAATERERLIARVCLTLERHFPRLDAALIGFYWPFRGELDLRGFVTDLIGRGASAALPAVIEKQAPLEFRAWAPGDPLAPGAWRIPVPVRRRIVAPTVLLVPLLGFDARGYRLGNGGGYYDRTLAQMSPKPLTLGVGPECCRLDTIYPCPHDIPMDAIVTETGIRWPGDARSPRETENPAAAGRERANSR